MGVSANARGDVLWLARTPDYYAPWEVWYSELVPEPGSLGAICIGAAAVGLSRRCRRR
ncbi:MAG: PEP-CTERM sorting domain-containing protein [Fimbriimonadia bacterium]